MSAVYINPILSGFYPDPSICRVNDDYYLVTSSFAYYPGLPIFHSRDLVSWKQIGYAMNRPGQLNLDGAGVSRGLFAPTIRYHNGTYYISCTLVDKGGNFIISAKDPTGPWSDPAWFPEIDGIDPSLFFDDSGKVYIVYNSVAPDNSPLYDGHRTIRMYEIDIASMKLVGEEKLLVNGGVDINAKPVWIEAPHILKKDGWYYLLCAEGGTYDWHSEVVFRSRRVDGPYESAAINPILTQRHLDHRRKHPVTTAGHADLVETPDGRWYAVFLACRPYDDDHYNTGRETFLAPVTWENGWPIINYGHHEVQYRYPAPYAGTPVNPFSGNVHFRDDFNADTLDLRWMFLRTVHQPWWRLVDGGLVVQVRPETCAGKANPCLLAYRQQNQRCTAVTSMLFAAATPNEKAGLLIFQSEHHYYFICKSLLNDKPCVQLYRSTSTEEMELINAHELASDALQLKIVADRSNYSFYYAVSGEWKLLKENMDARFLSTKTAGGFVGCVFALYATSQGQHTANVARFNWFEYTGDDEVYNQ
ncbi:MAG TPA: glycoside hydrolase family 43 protein [Chitinophagaceae bacterium]|nr:glycoside hydrolase family 43 protein [Chitinophagaceae bacterium]